MGRWARRAGASVLSWAASRQMGLCMRSGYRPAKAVSWSPATECPTSLTRSSPMASRKLRKSSTKLSVSSPSLGASTPPLPRQSNHYQVEVALQARCDPLERAGINPEAVEEHHRFSLATPIQLVQSQASGLHEPATGKGGIPTVPWTARNFDHGMCGSRSGVGPIPCSLRIRRTVERETWCPTFASSPTIRV